MVEGLSMKRAMEQRGEGAATLSCSGTEAHIEAAPDQNRPRVGSIPSCTVRRPSPRCFPQRCLATLKQSCATLIVSLKAPLTSHEREKSELNWRGKYTCSISLFVELRTANLCPSYTPLRSFREFFFGNVHYFPCGGSIINNSKLQTKA
ncbi:hypothetical protein PI124_g7557 [Phytophthora idaei]|nr:hypothetical protein PI125_g14256 [Phytophthora idaei]KAG3141564.1 hypothetical protein PI126_g15449 [Phytophthora idaei]KAG3247761.1 hypothetical protein PI124_g7557 [Phytophthora idaei]